MASSSRFPNFLRILTWAVYLGCSWTWCIGMFLPVILVSEFGNIAWFVFAIPNVVGAAAMGWTLIRPGASERIVAEHRTACVAFTAVTFAFHIFFLYWLTYIGLMPVSFAIFALAAGVLFGVAGRWLNGLDLLLSWVVLGISLAVLARGAVHPVFGVADPIMADRVLLSMPGLAAVCLFGFLLCPYLDVTFHRARQQLPPAAAKAAFGIGFGLVFLAMIVLTLMYAGDFARDRFNRPDDDRFGSFGKALVITWVVLHMAVQTGFTFAAHIRALPRPRAADLMLWGAAGLLSYLTIFAIHQDGWFTVKQLHIQMLSGQLMYHLFMSFYGLVFPAYVWIFMVPIGGRVPSRSTLTIGIWGGSMLLAAPMFWMAFVNQGMLWLIPGVGILLGARLVAGSTRATVQRSMFNG